MGLIPIRGQAVLEPSACGFPGAQRARTRVLGRGCKCRSSQAHKRPLLHPVLYPVLQPVVPLFLHPRKALGALRHRGAGPPRTHLPFLQMGQHWSGSYTGSTHSVCGHADTAHSTSPLASQRHRSHGDTCNTGHGQGQRLHPGLKPRTLPQPMRTGTEAEEAPLGASAPTRPGPEVALSLLAPHRGASVFINPHSELLYKLSVEEIFLFL